MAKTNFSEICGCCASQDDGFGSFAAIAARVSKMFNGVITEIGVELSGLSNTLGSAASVVVLQVLHIKNQAVGAGCSLRNACCQVHPLALDPKLIPKHT